MGFRDIFRLVRDALDPGPGIPDPPNGIPTAANTKAEIVSWLLGRGVDLDAQALGQLSKAELLTLVADLVDAET